MDFGKASRKRKSQTKYEAFSCLEVWSQRPTSDKLFCFHCSCEKLLKREFNNDQNKNALSNKSGNPENLFF